MVWHRIEAAWRDYLPQAQTAWPKISRVDLELTLGRRDLLVRKLQEAYGLSYEDADDWVMSWQLGVSPTPSAAPSL